jgi:hypothetical protein
MLENELADVISLNGTWQIELGDQRGEIRVPGAWEAQGYSGKAGVIEAAVYRRTFDVPASWDDADVWLRFGAVSYYAEVFVNGAQVGTHEGLWTPFEFDVTRAVRAGETNTLEVRVTKPGYSRDRFPYRDVLVGFLPYVFDNFGGIWQDVTLVAHRVKPIRQVLIDPHLYRARVEIRVLSDPEDKGETLTATVLDPDGQIVGQGQQEIEKEDARLVLNVEAPKRWSPTSPKLYTVIVERRDANGVTARATRQFGFRVLRNEGERLLLNGTPIHLRGALSWGWDPNTLAPLPTDDEVRDEFRRVRELGFNMVKLCLFVPPENVFRIADEEGMLLWLELPLWLPNLSDHLRQQARVEYADIMQRVMHHPSVVIYSLGCELGADMADAALLDALNATVRGSTRGALVCDNSGSGEAYGGLTFDYADFNDYHFYADLHYFSPLLDLFHRDWRPARPLIFGEFCDCDDYRDPAALLVDGKRPAWRDYLGVEGNLDRWAYSVQENRVAQHKLSFSDAQMAAVSRQQSFVVRKTILERTRTRREIGGYVLTGLRDTPMSTSGVFDDVGRHKFDPQAFRQFNSEAVLLLEQGRSRRWVHGGDRPYRADLFNHRAGSIASFRILLSQPNDFVGGELVWRLVSPRGVERTETLSVKPNRQPSPVELARLELALPDVAQAEAWTLEVELNGVAQNGWNLWLYPALSALNAAVYDPAGTLGDLAVLPRADFSTEQIVIASAFTLELERFVRRGGRAVLVQAGTGGLPVQQVPFWRESIKLLCDHPLMNAFPHAGFADLQFYHLATDCAFVTAAFADMDVTHVMRRLDARLFSMLDYVVDVRVGAGRLLATTLRLFGGGGDQVQGLEANVAGEYLLRQMVRALES